MFVDSCHMVDLCGGMEAGVSYPPVLVTSLLKIGYWFPIAVWQMARKKILGFDWNLHGKNNLKENCG